MFLRKFLNSFYIRKAAEFKIYLNKNQKDLYALNHQRSRVRLQLRRPGLLKEKDAKSAVTSPALAVAGKSIKGAAAKVLCNV